MLLVVVYTAMGFWDLVGTETHSKAGPRVAAILVRSEFFYTTGFE
jgi:hypothetical protein